ncbi:MAG: hypothetical protein AAGJ10_07470 [Bacteroidota bacterium]
MPRLPLEPYKPRTPHGERIVAGRTARTQTRKAAARAKADRAKASRAKASRATSNRAKVGKKTYVRRKGGQTLPGWNDLAATEQAPPKRTPRAPSWIDQVPTQHAVLAILGLALVATLYIGHVHATTEVLAEVQQRRAEHERLSLQYNRLRADFDMATSPSAIYDRAKAIGLTEGLAYGPTIRLDD